MPACLHHTIILGVEATDFIGRVTDASVLFKATRAVDRVGNRPTHVEGDRAAEESGN